MKKKNGKAAAWLFLLLLPVWAVPGVTPCFAGETGGGRSIAASGGGPADQAGFADGDEVWLLGEEEETDTARPAIADPLEPLNRFFFRFNDRLYFRVIKPVATVYARVTAEDVRICVRNFFTNLSAPVRMVNNILQGKVNAAGIELARFALNSTLGVVGLADAARDGFGLAPPLEEDLGQTLGVYGIGPGIYLNWPLLGPSTVRDTVGMVGDAFLEPLTYVANGRLETSALFYGVEELNHASLTLGDYELFITTSLDPYSAMRDIYYQYRQGRINDLSGRGDGPAR
ncbi:MAG: VacJ family lipoprotein [Desulfobacterales bacterium]|nr:VacJ family lipoprotein [Desulfobacterales bacterium]